MNILFELPDMTLVNIKFNERTVRPRTLLITKFIGNSILFFRYTDTDQYINSVHKDDSYELLPVSEKDADLWIRQFKTYQMNKNYESSIDIKKIMRYSGPTFKYKM